MGQSTTLSHKFGTLTQDENPSSKGGEGGIHHCRESTNIKWMGVYSIGWKFKKKCNTLKAFSDKDSVSSLCSYRTYFLNLGCLT